MDLHPPGVSASVAYGTCGSYQVGWITTNGTDRPALWSGNAGPPCVLESANEPVGLWSTVLSPWTTNNGWVLTTLTNTSPAQFYRLRAN